MGLAFWRSKKRAADAAGKPATRPQQPQDDDVDPAAGLRARARQRLIGAAALLLAVAVVVPMVLDPEPKPVSENIPIDIPSERAPFTPRLSLPPVTAADSTVTPPPDQAPVLAVKAESKAEPKVEAKPEAKAVAKSELRPATQAAAKVEETKPARGEEPRKAAEVAAAPVAPAAAATTAGKFAVQTAAPASEKAARDLVERLKKAGFTAYTEKVETKDGPRYRVRVGPYATREDADKARARLKSQGFGGNLVAA